MTNTIANTSYIPTTSLNDCYTTVKWDSYNFNTNDLQYFTGNVLTEPKTIMRWNTEYYPEMKEITTVLGIKDDGTVTLEQLLKGLIDFVKETKKPVEAPTDPYAYFTIRKGSIAEPFYYHGCTNGVMTWGPELAKAEMFSSLELAREAINEFLIQGNDDFRTAWVAYNRLNEEVIREQNKPVDKIVHEFLGCSPMTGPTGAVFALRSNYNND